MIKRRITYTLLSCYESCHKKCYLQYFKQVVPYEKVNHRPFMVGIVADWLFGKWITEENYVEGWMADKAEDIYNWFEKRRSITYLGPNDKHKMLVKLNKAARLMEDAAFANDFPDRKIDVQTKLSYIKDGVEYFGKLDLWFPDEGLIWDLKITQSSRYLNVFQLHMFAWLMENNNQEVKGLAFLSPMMKKSLREHDWCEADRVELERRVFSLVEKIKASNWKMDASSCWGCPVARFCEGDMEIESSKKIEAGGFTINF